MHDTATATSILGTHARTVARSLLSLLLTWHTNKHRSVWDDYEADTELIGRGAFARVFRALRREDNTPVAIKVIGRETKAFAQQRRGE